MPVYSRRSGGKVVKGFVYSPFYASEFLASATGLYRDRNVDIAIYDGDRKAENLLAFRQGPGVADITASRKIMVANREWTLQVSDKKASLLTPLSILTIVFGVVAASLIMAIGWLITKRAAEDREVIEWLKRHSAVRDSLTRELNHRVKNTLANVLSIAALTRRRSRDIDEFNESFTDRIRALSATHDLLGQADWRHAELGEIVRSELAPYLRGEVSHAYISGPEISLAPNDAMSLGLALHELATNAAKYGAFSTSDGRVYVTWKLSSADRAELLWREEGGPEVKEPTRRGLGRDLIEKVVAHELGAEISLQFLPEGVRCTLHVPVRQSGEFRLRNPRPE
jgi:two-component sensor histidine kinase